MRIIILTQYYPPETGAPQNRLSDMARRFKARGFDVHVLTAKPNYPKGVIAPAFRRGLYNRTLQDQVPVTHCLIFVTRSKKIILRLLNYFSFVISSALTGAFLLPTADLLIVESPPLFLSISAWFLSRLKRARLILNISDLYPETAISLGMLQQPWLQKLFYAFEAWSYQKAALVTGQTQGIVNSIQRRFPHKPVYLLTNGIDLDALQLSGPPHPHKDSHPFIVGYAGILGYAQNLHLVTKAAQRLSQYPNIEFHLYGDGPLKSELSLEIQQLGLHNVKLFGHHPHAEILAFIRNWDVGLVPLTNTPLMAGALPSKMFEFMGMGLPILLSAPAGEASHLIQRANAGLWIEPDSPQKLADTVLALQSSRQTCRELGENGRSYVAQHYHRAKILDDFISYLHQMSLTKGIAPPIPDSLT